MPTCKTWQWTPTLREEFARSKKEIITRVEDGVKTYDLDKLTCVSSDWSKAGIGLLVSQKYCDCDLAKAPRCCKEEMFRCRVRVRPNRRRSTGRGLVPGQSQDV